MREDLRHHLALAIRTRDPVAVAALGTALAPIENAEAFRPTEAHGLEPGRSPVAGAVAGLGASEVPRRDLTAADLERIVRTEMTEMKAAADDYERRLHRARADRLRAEAEILSRYLPDTGSARRRPAPGPRPPHRQAP